MERASAPSDVAAGGASNDVDLSVIQQRSGKVIYRLMGDGPLLRYEGDCPSFFFDVPPGTTGLTAFLEWSSDVTRDVVLDIVMPNGSRLQSWDTWPHEGTSPIAFEVPSPEEGLWYAFMGPGSAGGMVHWAFTLTWWGVDEAAFQGLDPERLRDSADCESLAS